MDSGEYTRRVLTRRPAASRLPATIIEKVTLLTDRFQFEYTRQASGGGLTTTKFGWDRSANRGF
jgi:hypothetical protein